MQTVSAAWTAQEEDLTRHIAHSLLVSWFKDANFDSRAFTIGASTIGGQDLIGINPGAIGGPGQYGYFDETDYVQSLSWERQLNFPTGGMNMALAEAELDNTSGRFLPDYMGGNSELFTSVYKSRRPLVIGAGFNLDGVDQTIPQFAGILKDPPQQSLRNRLVGLQAADYIDFFSNRFLDQESMFTAKRTDEVYETLLINGLGLSTAQFELDHGLNTIPFGIFERGTRYSDIFHQLAEAENGHFFQDEEGIFRFENRQHWDTSPYNSVQAILATAQVIDAEAPNFDHVVNVVEVKGEQLEKQPNQLIYSLASQIPLPANADTSFFVDFDDPILEIDPPTNILANTQEDGSGSNITANISLVSVDEFARSAKYILRNSGVAGYLTSFEVTGRPARKVADIYLREQDSSSLTAYEERVLTIDNPYIQNNSWALSYALMVLQDFSEPDKVLRLTIRAVPRLQFGDLISWQGSSWRIFGIKSKLSASAGFVQELLIFKREIRSFFKIGISTIGSIDGIAP